MKEQAESRKKIKEGIDKRKHSIDDRAKHMGLAVDDKKIIAGTSHKLRLGGTKEGAEAMKNAIKESAKVTHREFENQNKELEKKHNECKKSENDLKRRTDSSKKDAQDAKKTSHHIKEVKGAKSLLAKAEHAATDDARYTNKEKERQEHDRKTSEKRREQQKRHLSSSKLKW